MKTRRIRIHNRFSLTSILIAVAALFALSYAAFAASPFVSGPHLEVSLQTTDSGETLIQGATKRVSSVWINDLPVPITDQGEFSALRTYPPGYTEIVVRAEDRFGRSREHILTLVNNHFVDYASEENSKESDEEINGETSSSEGNEGGEASSN